MTPQRIAICQIMSVSRSHPTAITIYEQIRAQYPSLSLMTVYNTLNTLVDLGMISTLGNAGDNQVHFDGNTCPHINLACTACHKIVDMACEKLVGLNEEVSNASGFKILGARMMYYGLCPDCQKEAIP